MRCVWPEFTFDSEVQLITALPPTQEWIVDIQNEKRKVQNSFVYTIQQYFI